MKVLKRLGLLGVLMLGTATAALAEGMAVEPGDVLRVTVREAPEIGRDDARVDADGRIMLPQLGGVSVAGSDLDAIRVRISSALVAADLIKQPTVLVEFAKYRPFYVGGTVTSPGAIEFEPGLTVRHALILAGGLARGAGPDAATTADLVELKAKWKSANYALLRIDSTIAGLQAELDHGPRPDFSAVPAPFVDPATRAEVESIDTGLYDDRAASWKAKRENLKQAVSLVDLEIDVLTKQTDLQNQEKAIQADQVAKAQTLVDKGVMPLPRLQELEREASRLSRDLLEAQTYAARAQQNRQTQQYALESADTEWRIDVRAKLADALLQQSDLRSQSEVLATALLAAGVALNGKDTGPLEPDVVIHRGSETLTAGLDTEVRPGDVLEVSIAPVPAG